MESLRLDADLSFTAPWNRRAIEVARPQVTEIDLGDLAARWGQVTFRAAGRLTVDADGVPEGQLTIRAREWRRILDMAEAVDALPPGSRGTLEAALGLLAGPNDALDVPLEFSGGSVYLGIIPIGAAPRLLIR